MFINGIYYAPIYDQQDNPLQNSSSVDNQLLDDIAGDIQQILNKEGMSGASSGDLLQNGQNLQKNDFQSAQSDFNRDDNADFQAFENDLYSDDGDGNNAVYALVNAVKSGKLSQSDAAALGSQVQQIANANGGGKIIGSATEALKNALGGVNVLANGQERSLGEVLSQAFN